jgi:membrane protease YdiL (CAAX protease family)
MVSITSFGYVIAYVRLETGSIWPAIVLHAAWNSVILRALDPMTTGAGATLWTGESGVLTALTLVAAASYFSRRLAQTHAAPSRENILENKVKGSRT